MIIFSVYANWYKNEMIPTIWLVIWEWNEIKNLFRSIPEMFRFIPLCIWAERNLKIFKFIDSMEFILCNHCHLSKIVALPERKQLKWKRKHQRATANERKYYFIKITGMRLSLLCCAWLSVRAAVAATLTIIATNYSEKENRKRNNPLFIQRWIFCICARQEKQRARLTHVRLK